jgi:hypothetical protein
MGRGASAAMTPSLDIYRTADVPLKQYGDEASYIAMKRAKALANDIEDAAMWLGVMRAIRALTSTTRPDARSPVELNDQPPAPRS